MLSLAGLEKFLDNGEETFNFRESLGRIASFIAVVACIGLQITDVYGAALLFVAAIIIYYSDYKLSAKRLGLIFAIALTILAIKCALPRAAIQEGHNIFVMQGEGEALEKGLPPEVFAYMKTEFLKNYPLEKRIDPKTGQPRKIEPVPDKVYTFSADSIFSKTKYSRVVDSIDFDDINSFRGGFTNEVQYNWFGDMVVKRESMPFFVMYELSPSSVGSSLCWQGHALFETSPDRFTPIYQAEKLCLEIKPEDAGRRVFGLAFNNKTQQGFWDRFREWRKGSEKLVNGEPPLSITLQLSSKLTAAEYTKNFLRSLGVLLVILITIKIRWRKLAVPALLIGLATAQALVYCPQLFGEYFIHEGGEDGTTHDTMGRNILRHFVNGEILEALRGGQDVFWDTPGFRYFRGVEKFFFGDTDFGNLMIALLLPVALYGFLSRFFSKSVSLGMALLFMIAAVFPMALHISFFDNFGLAYYLYVMVARGGWPEVVANTSFLAALGLAFRYFPERNGAYLWYGFIANFLLFMAVFTRPNLALASLAIVAYLAVRLLLQGRYKEMIVTGLGFVPVSCMLLHNYYFGGKLHLFTGSVELNMQLGTPPAVYFNAVKDIAFMNFHSENISRVVKHTLSMIGPWYRALFIPALFIALFQGKRISPEIRLISFICLILHSASFVFVFNYFRYVFLTWTLTLIVNVYMAMIWTKSDKAAPANAYSHDGGAP